MGRTKKRTRHHRHRSPSSSTDSENNRNYKRKSKSKRDSRLTLDSLDRFTEAVTSVLERSSARNTNVGFKGDAVPIFDPENCQQSAQMWCKKVDELREVFMWTEEATIYFALSKLRGLAEVWYKGLRTLNYNWQQWKEKLQEAFPSTTDFYETLMNMIKRRKRNDESYTKYYYEKMSLLNACQIEGEKAVSCIIGGLDDRVIKTGAKAGNYKTPEELFRYLNKLNDSASFSNISHRSKGHFKRHQNEKQKPRSNTSITCFKCGKEGHFANKCFSKANTDYRCNTCRSHQHSEANCPKKGKSEQNKTVALLEMSTTDASNIKYYKDIKINDVVSKAYIDFGSSCTVITLTEAQRLGLKVSTEDKVTLHGYGKGSVLSMGSVKVKLEIDQITAMIKAIVVSDKEQNIPVIVGRNFTELPQIIVIKNDKTLRLLERDESKDFVVPDLESIRTKIVLRAADTFIIPSKHQGIVKLKTDEYSGNVYVEASFRPQEGRESCVPRTVLCIDENNEASMPFLNLADCDIILKKDEVIARGIICEEEIENSQNICRIETEETELSFDDINVGQVSEEERKLADERIKKAQEKQKHHFDKRRKAPRKYKKGDLVLSEKTEQAPNVSRKLLAPFSGPFVVKKILQNDRYLVQDMEGTHRTLRKGTYEKVVAVDRMKPWRNPGGVSDETSSDSGEDEVVLSADEADTELGTS